MKHSRCRRVNVGIVVLATLVLVLIAQVDHPEAAEARKFTLINVIFDGTKIWLPSSLMMHEGDRVELTLINKLDAPHGFKIEALGIETVVPPMAKTSLRFTASKRGLHTFICHIHPPHIGGQILVIE